MNRIHGIITVVGIISIITIGFLVYLNLQSASNNIESPAFSWEIHTGDEFLFNATGSPEVEDVIGNLSYLDFSNIIIKVKIISLPDLENVSDPASFASLVLSHVELQCEINNLTIVQPELQSLVRTTASLGFLPVGGWSEIDSYFPNEWDYGSDCDNCIFTRIEDGHFYIESSSIEMDYWIVFSARVDMTTGIPYWCRFYTIHGYVDASLTLTLFE